MDIGTAPSRVQGIPDRLREAPLAALRRILTDDVVLQACRKHDYEWRERLFGPVVTVFHYLGQAIQREVSFAATWQELWTPVAADFPEIAGDSPDRSALTHARARFPRAVMHTLAEWACRDAAPAGATWKGHRLRALDGTTLSMPDRKELAKHFGRHRTKHGLTRYPLARLVTLLDLGNCTLVGHEFGPYTKGEPTYAKNLVALLKPGDLVLVDRGLTGSPTLARIRARGATFLGRKNARLKVEDVRIVRYLGHNDWIVELPVSKSAREEDPTLPENVQVRLFQATWRAPTGEKIAEWFVTSLTDPEVYARRKLANLYYERWRIETSYQEFKQVFHGDVLRSKTVDNVYKELDAHVLAYQMVRRLIAAAGAAHGVKPSEISLLNAARWTVSFSARMASATPTRLPEMYRSLLAHIAASRVDVRPGRLEPRAVRRERKHYPYLRQRRSDWRASRLAEGA